MMNERIESYLKQHFCRDYFNSYGDSVEDEHYFMYREEVDGLIELIVRECANVLRAESERLYKLSAEEKDELFASNFEICAEKCVDNEVAIKEHFGVE